MVNNIVLRPEDSGINMSLEFTFFGTDNIFRDNFIFDTEKQVEDYIYQTKKQTFLRNFCYFIRTLSEHVANDKQVTSINRLQAANKYFNETHGLTLEKICSMVIGIQGHLMAVMPSGKNPEYDKFFGWVNEIIKFCKNETSGR